MSHIDKPDDPTKCANCGEMIPQGREYRIGPNMWHFTEWTCRHEIILECPKCYKEHGKSIPSPKCTICGNECSYN